jgi:hypothetical protein
MVPPSNAKKMYLWIAQIKANLIEVFGSSLSGGRAIAIRNRRKLPHRLASWVLGAFRRNDVPPLMSGIVPVMRRFGERWPLTLGFSVEFAGQGQRAFLRMLRR